MNRIDKKTATQLLSLAVDINAEYNAIDEVWKELGERIARINVLREEAAELMDGEAADAETYYEDKSEKWQEGPRGEAFQEWAQTLRQVADSLGEEIDVPDEIERPEWLSEITDQEFEEFVD